MARPKRTLRRAPNMTAPLTPELFEYLNHDSYLSNMIEGIVDIVETSYKYFDRPVSYSTITQKLNKQCASRGICVRTLIAYMHSHKRVFSVMTLECSRYLLPGSFHEMEYLEVVDKVVAWHDAKQAGIELKRRLKGLEENDGY